jgi:glutaredoxin-like YruB-family protein
MIEVNSHNELVKALKNTNKAYCLLYKKDSELSECAIKSVKEGLSENTIIFSANVSEVKDIHTKYNVTTVPTLLIFEQSKYINLAKGCNSSEYYKSIFDEISIFKKTETEQKAQKRVTVYSTPTCTYCTQIKKYFIEKGIKFTDIDVSKNTKAAEEMVKRSGQQGVPQTNINGQIVIGFDRLKINSLLGIE